MRSLALATLSLLGCTNAALPAPEGESHPEAVQQGLYRVTVAANADDCDPARFTGEAGVTDIATAPMGISVAFPVFADVTGRAWYRQDLLASKDYASSHPLYMQRPDVPSSSTYEGTEAVQLTWAGATRVELNVLDDWTTSTTLDGGDLPRTRCRSDRTLTYTFVKPCTSPLRLSVGPDGNEDCL
jgi:hypothetical protein